MPLACACVQIRGRAFPRANSAERMALGRGGERNVRFTLWMRGVSGTVVLRWALSNTAEPQRQFNDVPCTSRPHGKWAPSVFFRSS